MIERKRKLRTVQTKRRTVDGRRRGLERKNRSRREARFFASLFTQDMNVLTGQTVCSSTKHRASLAKWPSSLKTVGSYTVRTGNNNI